MKGRIRAVIRLFALAILLTGIVSVQPASGMAAKKPTVQYVGGAEKFVFLRGYEKYTASDLFQGSFKNVMPGDVVREEVVVKNNLKKDCKVKIYMKAIPHNEMDNFLQSDVASEEDLVTMTDFLEQLSMTVKVEGKELFHASPNELSGLEDNVLLGTFAYGESANLTVELEVPIELDEQYANRVGEVDWVFTAEEINTPKNKKPNKKNDKNSDKNDGENSGDDSGEGSDQKSGLNPGGNSLIKTGDHSPILLWAFLLVTALGVLFLLFVTRRKDKEENDGNEN